MAKVLGISAFYHDSAAALVVDGRIVAAAQEERFSRIKNDSRFPTAAARFCLEFSGLCADDLDAVVYYEKPFVTFERILETILMGAPDSWRFFSEALPVWLREKLFMKSILRNQLSESLGGVPRSWGRRLFFSEHHLSHSAAAFFPSPFMDAAILTVDGVGEWKTLTISHGQGNQIQPRMSLNFPDSWGLFYAAVTVFLGFKVNSGEYKMMGLGPYGDPQSDRTKGFQKKILTDLLKLGEDGSVSLNPRFFAFTTTNEMIHTRRWEELFGMKQRVPESELTSEQADLALAAQKVLEEGLLRLAKTAKAVTGSPNLVLSGGVALNCVANRRLRESGLFDRIWVQPAAGDAGSAAGAALVYEYIRNKTQRFPSQKLFDGMSGAFLGPEFSDEQIERALCESRLRFYRGRDFTDVCERTAALLAENKVVGWFQGRMEFGPRALGHRSILASCLDPEMQIHLNQKIKFRETFRPFAPVVLAEDAGEYFESSESSPYMLFTAEVKKQRMVPRPHRYKEMSLREKLMSVRSDLPAVTHVDGSARLQTIHADLHPRLHRLLCAYKEKTGYSVLTNTSFNVRGEPIVCTPQDAIRCFRSTRMDALVMGSMIIVAGS